MAKEKRDLLHTSTKVTKLVVLIGLAVSTIYVALTFFAKSKTVQMLDQRLGLSISKDIVDGEKSNVRWMEQQVVFERKEEPPTSAEHEIIKAAKKALAEKEELHKERVKNYEEQYKQKF